MPIANTPEKALEFNAEQLRHIAFHYALAAATQATAANDENGKKCSEALFTASVATALVSQAINENKVAELQRFLISWAKENLADFPEVKGFSETARKDDFPEFISIKDDKNL